MKSRFTRSPAGSASLPRHVVRTPFRRLTPAARPASSRGPPGSGWPGGPCSGSSACIRGAPYVPSLSSWISWILLAEAPRWPAPAPRASASAKRSTRSARPPTRDTSWRSGSRPGSPSRIRRLREVIDSLANQAAAFPRISRSSSSCLASRRSWRSSARSAVVSPSACSPSSMSACVAHFRIVFGDGSNSFASSSGLRPARTNSISRRLYSGGYVFLVRAIGTPPFPQSGGVHQTGGTSVDQDRDRQALLPRQLHDLVRG